MYYTLYSDVIQCLLALGCIRFITTCLIWLMSAIYLGVVKYSGTHFASSGAL